MEAKEGGSFPRESTVKSDIFALGRADFNAGVDLMQREVSSTGCLRRFFPSPRAWKSFFILASARFSINCSIFPLTSRPFGAGKKVSTTPAVFACSSSSAPRDADLNKSCFHTHNAPFPAGKVGLSRDFQLAASAIAPSS